MDGCQKNLKEYENFLKRHRLISPDRSKFYVYWVKRFIRYSQNKPSIPVPKIIELYLKSMETDSRFADWQVKQAADAILLYVDRYHQADPAVRKAESKPKGSRADPHSAAWRDIFNRLHENMRIKHYSPKTEKSYRI